MAKNVPGGYSMNGYYSFSREHDETLDFLSVNANRLYFYLVRRASYAGSDVCPRGCLLDTLKGLSKATRISVKGIRYGLKTLEESGLIVKKGHDLGQRNRRHIIEIKGYVVPGEWGTNKGNSRENEGQIRGTLGARLEEGKKEERKRERNDIYAPAFEPQTAVPAPASPKGPAPGPAEPAQDLQTQKQIQAQNYEARVRARLKARLSGFETFSADAPMIQE